MAAPSAQRMRSLGALSIGIAFAAIAVPLGGLTGALSALGGTGQSLCHLVCGHRAADRLLQSAVAADAFGFSRPGFHIQVTPAVVDIGPGGVTSFTVRTQAKFGFSGRVRLSAEPRFAGLLYSFESRSVPANSTTTLTASATAVAPGAYSITILGASRTKNHAVTVRLVVD